MGQLFRVKGFRFVVPCLCGAVLLWSGAGLGARQAELTEESYGPLMTEIRFIVGDAELHVDARYWPDLGEDLDKLFPMFRQMEAFWEGRGNDEAVGFTPGSACCAQGDR